MLLFNYSTIFSSVQNIEYEKLLIIVIWFIFKVPENMSAPALQSLTPTSILVDWSAPEKPNGLIAYYQIERRVNGTSNITMVTKALPEAKQQYVDDTSELSPFTVYDYRAIVVNGAGSLGSQWTTIITKSSSRSHVPYLSLFFKIFFMLNHHCNIFIVLCHSMGELMTHQSLI